MPNDEKELIPPKPLPKSQFVEKVESMGSEELSETHRFLITGIEEAHRLASRAHEQSSQSMSLIEAMTSSIESRDTTIKREFDHLREDIKLNNSQNSDAIKGFTLELRSFNKSISDLTVSLARMESVKEAQAKMETELAGQNGRLTAHIESQAKRNATIDTQLKNLDNSTDRDYKRLEGSVIKLADEFRTAIKESRSEIKKVVGDNKKDHENIENMSKPALEFVKFVRWFAYIVMALGGCLWTYIQIADRFFKPNEKSNQPIIQHNTGSINSGTKPPNKP